MLQDDTSSVLVLQHRQVLRTVSPLRAGTFQDVCSTTPTYLQHFAILCAVNFAMIRDERECKSIMHEVIEGSAHISRGIVESQKRLPVNRSSF